MIQRKWIGLCFFMIFASIAIHQRSAQGGNAQSLSEMLDSAHAAVFNSPEVVETYHIIPMGASPRIMTAFPVTGIPNNSSFEELRIDKVGPNLDSSQIKEVQTLLQRPRAYRSQVREGCQFRPGVGLKFIKGKEFFTVLFCFGCEEWAVDLQGKIFYSDFGSDKAALIRLAKQFFPNDLQIQALGSKK